MVELKNAFAREFKRCLVAHYGKVPSCAKIARDFTLISRELEPISVETVRKWLLGINLPHSARLRTLVIWLNLDIRVLDDALKTNGSNFKSTHSKEPVMSTDALRLVNLFELLDSDAQQTVLQIAELYKNSPPSENVVKAINQSYVLYTSIQRGNEPFLQRVVDQKYIIYLAGDSSHPHLYFLF